jgi:hypothetical protein
MTKIGTQMISLCDWEFEKYGNSTLEEFAMRVLATVLVATFIYKGGS